MASKLDIGSAHAKLAICASIHNVATSLASILDHTQECKRVVSKHGLLLQAAAGVLKSKALPAMHIAADEVKPASIGGTLFDDRWELHILASKAGYIAAVMNAGSETLVKMQGNALDAQLTKL